MDSRDLDRREMVRRLVAIGASSPTMLVRPSLAEIIQLTTSSSWPNAMNTGVPTDCPLTSAHSLIITTDGATVDALDITGTVDINADNVTLKRCRVRTANFYIVRIRSGKIGAVVRDCEIDGVGKGNDGSNGIQGTGTILRNNIYNVENGITVDGTSPTLIEDNYIHDLLASGAPHYDGIQIDGGISNVTIRHNTVINRWMQTSAVMIDNYFGPVSKIIVDNNLLLGGGYTIYVDGQFNSNPISGVSITNNHMGRGYWGITNFNKTSPVYTGNTNDGAALARAL